MLRKWDKLPEQIRIDAVRPYYDRLVKKKFSLFLKRMFDVILSAVLLVLLSPLFVIISVLIVLDSDGGIFYRQERITQYGRKFKIFKFRTMIIGADKIGTLVTIQNDNRITKLGRKLRKYRLDEVPQLINVIIGDMSFVGTRPETEQYVKKYTPEMCATLLLPAGITSEASIRYKDESNLLNVADDIDRVYVEKVLPEKMKYNLDSLKHFSFAKDIMIMFRTVIAVVKN